MDHNHFLVATKDSPVFLLIPILSGETVFILSSSFKYLFSWCLWRIIFLIYLIFQQVSRYIGTTRDLLKLCKMHGTGSRKLLSQGYFSNCIWNHYHFIWCWGWMKNKLESRLLGEISVTSECRWYHPYGRKWRTKEPLDGSERREWKNLLKTQHSEN